MRIKIGNFLVSNEPARFGLKQAEGAMKFAKDQTQVGAVLGVIVGVLGYQNAVAVDVAAANNAERVEIGLNKEEISKNDTEIGALQRENAELQREIAASTARQGQLAEIAKLFATGK